MKSSRTQIPANPVGIVIDTSVLRHDPQRRKAAMTTLKELAGKKMLKLHIPHIVAEEFISQQIAAQKEPLNRISSAIADLSRRKPSSGEWDAEIESISSSLRTLAPNVLQSVRLEFDAWARSLGAERMPLSSDSTNQVFAAYFAGEPPFGEPRKRDDIPDAFIYEEIKRLAIAGRITAVVADGPLRNAIACLANVNVFPDLDSWVKSPGTQSLLLDSKLAQHLQAILQVLAAEHRRPDVQLTDASIIDALVGSDIESYSEPPGAENGESTITSVYSPRNVKLTLTEGAYYGEQTIVCPVEFDVEVNVDYYIFKSDYFALPDGEELPHVTDWNTHYFLAEATLDIHVVGRAAIKLFVDADSVGESPSFDELNECLDIDEVTLDSVDQIEVN